MLVCGGDLFVSNLSIYLLQSLTFTGYWPFGMIMCALWQMSDVTMCTSSIMHMCIISLDRYKCIRDPMSIRSRSKISVALRIAAVWFFAVMISTPLAFLAAFRPSDILNSKSECIISNPNFLVYGSIAAFFLPLTVMLVTYSLTINLLRKKAIEIERSGGLRRSVSNRRYRPKRSHSPLRPTMSLNCEGNPSKWHYCRTSSTDDYSNLNGRQEIESKLTSLTSSSVEVNKSLATNVRFSSLKFPSSSEVKKQEGFNCRRTKIQNDALNPRKNVKIKETVSAEREQIVETYFPVEIGRQNTDTSISPLLPDTFQPGKKITNRRRSVSAGELRSQHQKPQNSSKLLSSKEGNLLLTDLTSVRYYHLHNSSHRLNRKETSNDDSITSNKISSQKQPATNSKSCLFRNRAIQRITELEKSSCCSLDDSTILANNSNSCFDRTSDCIRMDLDFSDPSASNLPQNAPSSVGNSIKKRRFLENLNIRFERSQTLDESQTNEFSRDTSRANRHHKSISKTVTNERKAVKVLGLMFLMFVACWAVFFCVNFAMGVCPECKFDESFFKYVLWLGYTSSLINPIIYTVFNLSFRRAFIRILTCQYCRFKSLKATQSNN